MSALLRDVAKALLSHGDLRCTPAVETDDNGTVTLTVVVSEGEQDAPFTSQRVFATYVALQRVCDLATLQALVARYDIKPDALTAFLREEDE